jgi:hypothetical protein
MPDIEPPEIIAQAKVVILAEPRLVYPPARLKGYSLAQLLAWYEENVCFTELIDPRGHRVAFDLSRFPYLVKLVNAQGGKVKKPLRVAEKIKAGVLSEIDFGGYNPDRAETLSWFPCVITTPLSIRKNVCQNIPGDEVYVRQVQKRGAKFKLLFCERVGSKLLVPVTSFRQEKEPKGETIWP